MTPAGATIKPARPARALLAALLLLAGCTGDLAASPGPGQYVITQPGTILIQRDARRKQLQSLPETERARLCGAPRSGWPNHGLVRNVAPDSQPGQSFARTMMEASAVWLAFGDEAALSALRRNLDRWARGGALGRLVGEVGPNSYYNLDRTLLPTIVAYGLIRDTLPKDKRERIHGWLEELVMKRGPRRVVDPLKVSSRNNHRYLRASVTMAWGALVGDNALFREGVRRFLIALEQMRPDGSLPLETDRGKEALFYQRHALGSLVVIAEMAAAQGHDLYKVSGRNGLTLRQGLDFLVRGIENPKAVAIHAPGPQNLGFLDRRGHGRHYMAWFEAWRARFPDDDLTLRMARILNERGSFAPPLMDDYAGAVTSCFFHPLPAPAGAD